MECACRLVYHCNAVDHGGRNACNMWFENVEVLVKSLSSAAKHRPSQVGKSDDFTTFSFCIISHRFSWSYCRIRQVAKEDCYSRFFRGQMSFLFPTNSATALNDH